MSDPDDKAPPAGTTADAPPALELAVPRQTAPRADNPLLDPHETEAWFESLPMANVGETARQVYKTLVEFNRIELPDALRAQTAEKFRPPVEYITTNLQRYYVDNGLPPSAKGAKTAALARELQKELAIAYKIIAKRMISGANPDFDRTLLITALHRALHYAGQTLLQHALAYTDWPPGLWREVNGMFDYAARTDGHRIAVKAGDPADRASGTSIEDQFKALLLFAGAAPHCLRQSQTRLLHAQLPVWTGYADFVSDADDGGEERFNIDLAGDAPPVHNALRAPPAGGRVAILDVHRLLEQLRGDIDSAPWDNRGGLQPGKPRVTRPLLRQLIVAWGRPPERRYVRTRLNFELQVVAGLHAIHDNLSANGAAPHTAAPAGVLSFTVGNEPLADAGDVEWSSGNLENATLAPLDSAPVGGQGRETAAGQSGIGDMRVTNRNPIKRMTTDVPADVRQASSSRTPSLTHRVRTINESAGGYCIRWEGERVPQVKIGELIGIESPADARRYGLGVIRWMRLQDDGGVDLGIEAVSTRCQAGQLREAAGGPGRERTPAYKCLLIDDTGPDGNQAASLVMAAMSLQTGVDLWLTTGGHEQRIRLTGPVEANSAFARYRFEVAGGTAHTDEDDSGSGPADAFEDLWNNL